MTASLDDLRMEGRVALVTGAAQGIGRAIAEAFAGAGATVVVIDRQEQLLEELAQELREAGAEVHIGLLDVRDHEAVDRVVDEVGEAYGHIDVVVNNAGGTYFADFVDSSPKGDETLIRENLLSAAWVIRASSRWFGASPSVINVTSIEAQRAAPGFAVYAAAKAGLEELTRTLALELADRGARVNAIAPDVVVTPGVGALENATTPMGRVGQPDEVAGVALFLATALSSFVTGAVIPVDGGNLAAAGWFRREGGWVTPSAEQPEPSTAARPAETD